ncbi:DUF4181 domain-containing protein [Psychrobacillus sp. NPDC093180]|uniref:DUF4181 domain-containing protein n=1 Tax=Psychrobacillus sp. NPDC093180 TaxID=3364489 RepID=UPI00380FC20F
MVWIKIGLFVVSIFILMYIFNKIMTKVLKVDKKSMFSNRYVNDLHKKIGEIISITFLVIIIAFNMWKFENPELANSTWYFLGVIMIFFVLDALVRALMERKYATNRKEYIYTLCEMSFMIIIIYGFAQTFWG